MLVLCFAAHLLGPMVSVLARGRNVVWVVAGGRVTPWSARCKTARGATPLPTLPHEGGGGHGGAGGSQDPRSEVIKLLYIQWIAEYFPSLH